MYTHTNTYTHTYQQISDMYPGLLRNNTILRLDMDANPNLTDTAVEILVKALRGIYMHTYIYTYTQIHIHAYMHACIHAVEILARALRVYTCIHTYSGKQNPLLDIHRKRKQHRYTHAYIIQQTHTHTQYTRTHTYTYIHIVGNKTLCWIFIENESKLKRDLDQLLLSNSSSRNRK